MKKENVARDMGMVKPPEGETMTINGGILEEANAISEAGYGQRGFRGRTREGQFVHVRKPKFHHNRHRNLAERDKSQFVRVVFETSDGIVTTEQIVEALRRFYRRD